MPSIIVRPLASREEYTPYFRAADAAFSPLPSEESMQRWSRVIMHRPDFQPEQLRGAFRDGQLLGGYSLRERKMRMGCVGISTGCIGGVVTFSEQRRQGVATALMQDAVHCARSQHCTLLLLDGIPNFYYRYGYIDMFDVSEVEVVRAAILDLPPSRYLIRSAAESDAAAILSLYNHQYGPYTGSFERSVELQAYSICNAQQPPVLAISPSGQVEGYLYTGSHDEIIRGREIAAQDREALFALLHYHARLFDDDKAPSTLFYRMPLTSHMVEWMVDAVEVSDTSLWKSPAEEWGVRGLMYQHRFTGWMAHLVNYPELMVSLLPELQARWRRSLAQWNGAIVLEVDDERCVLHIRGGSIELVERLAEGSYSLRLTAQDVIQGVFGYRSLAQLARKAHFPEEVCTVLSILFPSGHTWIPGTDWF